MQNVSKTNYSADYQLYLLRLWREGKCAEWRVTLQSADTKETLGFPTLFAAYSFLESLCEKEKQDEK